jgi:hypothetical protein
MMGVGDRQNADLELLATLQILRKLIRYLSHNQPELAGKLTELLHRLCWLFLDRSVALLPTTRPQSPAAKLVPTPSILGNGPLRRDPQEQLRQPIL